MMRNANNNRYPIIIPILLNDLLPPTIISEIKGIKFNSYSNGMKKLYKSLNVENNQIISLTDIFRLFKKTDELIETIEWCFQADYFLTIDTEYYWKFIEIEDFINNFILKPNDFNKKHFTFTHISYSLNKFEPTFDEEFYIYIRSGKIGLYILNKYLEVYKRILEIVKSTTK